MANRYWVGGSATWDGTAGSKWSTTSGGGGGSAVPTSSDDVFFDTADVITQSGARVCKSLTNTSFTGTFAGSGGLTISGSVTLGSGATYTNTSTITIDAASTFTCNGKTWAGGVTFNSAAATLSLADAFSSTGTLTITAGSLDTNGFAVTSGNGFTANAAAGTVDISSSLVSVAGTVNLTGAGKTVTATGSTIKLTGNALQTFSSDASYTLNDVWKSGTVGVSFSGGVNVSDLRLDGAGSLLQVLTTATLTLTTFTGAGTGLGNMQVIRSNTTGTAGAINKTTGSIDLDWVTIQDITFGGGATWTATDSIDVDNNSGITITPPSTGGGGLSTPLFGGGVVH